MICLNTNVILRWKKLQFVKIKFLSLIRFTAHYFRKGPENSNTFENVLFISFNLVFPKYICLWIPSVTELIITFHETNILGMHYGNNWLFLPYPWPRLCACTSLTKTQGQKLLIRK